MPPSRILISDRLLGQTHASVLQDCKNELGSYYEVVTIDKKTGKISANCLKCKRNGKPKQVHGFVHPTSNFVTHFKVEFIEFKFEIKYKVSQSQFLTIHYFVCQTCHPTVGQGWVKKRIKGSIKFWCCTNFNHFYIPPAVHGEIFTFLCSHVGVLRSVEILILH